MIQKWSQKSSKSPLNRYFEKPFRESIAFNEALLLKGFTLRTWKTNWTYLDSQRRCRSVTRLSPWNLPRSARLRATTRHRL